MNSLIKSHQNGIGVELSGSSDPAAELALLRTSKQTLNSLPGSPRAAMLAQKALKKLRAGAGAAAVTPGALPRRSPLGTAGINNAGNTLLGNNNNVILTDNHLNNNPGGGSTDTLYKDSSVSYAVVGAPLSGMKELVSLLDAHPRLHVNTSLLSGSGSGLGSSSSEDHPLSSDDGKDDVAEGVRLAFPASALDLYSPPAARSKALVQLSSTQRVQQVSSRPPLHPAPTPFSPVLGLHPPRLILVLRESVARATVEALRVGAGSDEAARNLLLWSKKVQPPTLPKSGDGAGEVASSSFGVAARSSMVLRFLSLDGARTMQRCLPFKQWTSDQKKRLGGLTSEFTAELAEASLAQFVRSSALSPPLHQFATVSADGALVPADSMQQSKVGSEVGSASLGSAECGVDPFLARSLYAERVAGWIQSARQAGVQLMVTAPEEWEASGKQVGGTQSPGGVSGSEAFRALAAFAGVRQRKTSGDRAEPAETAERAERAAASSAAASTLPGPIPDRVNLALSDSSRVTVVGGVKKVLTKDAIFSLLRREEWCALWSFYAPDRLALRLLMAKSNLRPLSWTTQEAEEAARRECEQDAAVSGGKEAEV